MIKTTVSAAFGALALLGLGACAREAPLAAAGCDMALGRPANFSTAATSDVTAGDTFEVRSFGPDCRNAVVALVVRAGDGAPLYAFAAPAQAVFPDVAAISPEPAAAAETLRTLLRRWVRVSVATTADEPVWTRLSGGGPPPALGTGAPNGPWSTAFDAATFADLRARALPMACFETGPDSAQCIYWEPAVAQALPLLAFQR